MNIKPKPGLVVRDPATYRQLPPEGAEVQDAPYWRRRLASGDVVRVDAVPAMREVNE